ncbi:hypothetical protein [Chamaesiphon sp.]|uniref:slr1601 family putative cell division protein n=1 Tax=Chamaesiphon sp. TaxID=2814140 RepID=UPI003593466F
MNALPSFEPPQQHPHRRKTTISPQPHLGQPAAAHTATPDRSPAQQSKTAAKIRVKINPTYAHRRQGLEVVTKLVTYSTLSIFGAITLVNSIGYSWSQWHKLQHLTTELQNTKVRTEKVKYNFSRSFAPESQTKMMQENSYKIAPDRLQIFLVNPNPNHPQPQPPQVKPHS